jgi:hypothetical protein
MLHMVYEHVHKPNEKKRNLTKKKSLVCLLLDMVELNQNNLLNIMAYKLNKEENEVQLNIQLQLML